jgi:hypothetical protein
MTSSRELEERLEQIERSEMLRKIKADLAYRLPQSGKPLGHIVLTREQAEQLVDEIGPPRDWLRCESR